MTAAIGGAERYGGRVCVCKSLLSDHVVDSRSELRSVGSPGI